VRWARWTDHLPLWVALGAVLSTGIYDPDEGILMALPLLVAAGVEASRRDLGHYQRWFEAGALLFFILDLARGRGVFPVAIHTLFVLGGIRLILPKETTQRRQLLLMSFLLFLTTAVSTTDLLFLLWALLWLGAAILALLQQSWESSAQLRRGLLLRPPYGRIPLWSGLTLVLGTAFFLVVPRLSAGLRPGFIGGMAAFGQAGLGEELDLSIGGPIQPNPAVVLRILPGPGTEPSALRGLGLLKGLVLEGVQGQRWVPSDLTPPSRLQPLSAGDSQAEFLFAASAHGILSFPVGLTSVAPPEAPLRAGPGASLRWLVPRARVVPLTITWNPGGAGLPEPRLSPRRFDLLTTLGREHEAARRWSFRLAPAILPTETLARSLEAGLRGFQYSLENPSGGAANPLEDFLERTQSGHCEYFASAMALMLRARSVPARVVNGYRLGPWIPEGGYFRVSQDQAHSWVEYWDNGLWKTADPTPTAVATAGEQGTALGPLSRWLDALRYRWDRHVVRFSGQDQEAGLSWVQEQWQGWEWHWKAPPRTWALGLGFLASLWLLWRSRPLWQRVPPGPGRIPALRPLLARLRQTAPPLPGDTVQTWLERLARLRPERAGALSILGAAVAREAYGNQPSEASTLARVEASAWKGWRPISPAARKPS
jgi:transglutaminase-like putative cysteine protease